MTDLRKTPTDEEVWAAIDRALGAWTRLHGEAILADTTDDAHQAWHRAEADMWALSDLLDRHIVTRQPEGQ